MFGAYEQKILTCVRACIRLTIEMCRKAFTHKYMQQKMLSLQEPALDSIHSYRDKLKYIHASSSVRCMTGNYPRTAVALEVGCYAGACGPALLSTPLAISEDGSEHHTAPGIRKSGVAIPWVQVHHAACWNGWRVPSRLVGRLGQLQSRQGQQETRLGKQADGSVAGEGPSVHLPDLTCGVEEAPPAGLTRRYVLGRARAGEENRGER